VPYTQALKLRRRFAEDKQLPSIYILVTNHSSYTMKVFSTSSDFNYSWDEVSTTNWIKYCPWNSKTPHVLSVDVLSRSVDPSTGILRTERLIACKQSAPRWLTTILGQGSSADESLVHEVSYVDPGSHTLTMCSVNMTFSHLLSVRETVQYMPHPESPAARTLFHQRAEITALCGGWHGIKRRIEDFTVERFGQNAAKGREGFEMVLSKAREVFREQRELLQALKEEMQEKIIESNGNEERLKLR